jgi:hypothetical protein
MWVKFKGRFPFKRFLFFVVVHLDLMSPFKWVFYVFDRFEVGTEDCGLLVGIYVSRLPFDPSVLLPVSLWIFLWVVFLLVLIGRFVNLL